VLSTSGVDGDGPDIVSEIGVRQIGVRHPEMPSLTPIRAPRVSDQKHLLLIIVAEATHSMPSNSTLTRLWHRQDTAISDSLTLEAVVHGEAKDERVTSCQTSTQLSQSLRNTLVLDGKICGANLVALSGRLGACPRACGPSVSCRVGSSTIVWPHSLRADADSGNTFDAVTNLGAGVGVDVAFHAALVVVDEEARRHKIGYLGFLDGQELECTADGICSAATDLALVVDWWPLIGLAEVDAWRQLG
jgi:hypothetical protein